MTRDNIIEFEVGPDGKQERVYSCRCGIKHRGDYAIYDYAHHECFHDSPLVSLSDDEVGGYLMCPECGKVFWEESAYRQFCPKCHSVPCNCEGEKYVPVAPPKLTAKEILERVKDRLK